MDCSPPGSAVHGIFQARILEWVAISFSRESFWFRDQSCISCTCRWTLYLWTTMSIAFKNYFIIFKLFYIGVYLINNVVFHLRAEWFSYIYICVCVCVCVCVCIISKLFSHLGYYRDQTEFSMLYLVLYAISLLIMFSI